MKSVLFDLDGTLLDTAHDLGFALNLQLERHGKPTIPHDQIWPVASHGSKGLLALGFGITPEDSSFEMMKNEYLNLYESVYTRRPFFLAGVENLLNRLDEVGVAWGIVTNKPRRFSEQLIKAVQMDGQNLATRSACLVCGDDADQPKPSPKTLFLACDAMQVQPKDCIYVGDAERDVMAGLAAGMETVVALFGYIAQTDQPENWGAHHLIEHPEALMHLI